MHVVTLRSKAALTVAVATISVGAFAAELEGAIAINPSDIKWGPAPASLPKCAKVAVLSGDPGKPGPFVMRLMVPAGYKIAPHSHSQAESLTIISGALYLGGGDKANSKNAKALKAGAFYSLPGKGHHFAFTKSATVIQINGEGPFDMSYMNPADDPQTAMKK